MKLLTLIKESEASEKANSLGLNHVGWGKYADKSGDVVAQTQHGKLVFLDKEKDEKPADLTILAKKAQRSKIKKVLDADFVMKQKISGAKGTNEGGIYLGEDGKKRYVKIYKNESQAVAEHLSDLIYNHIGAGVPKSTLFKLDNGKFAFASEMIEGSNFITSPDNQNLHLPNVTLNSFSQFKDLLNHENKENVKWAKYPKITAGIKKAADDFAKGFMTDVFLANWDAVGLENDNAFYDWKEGKSYRIDQGATFWWRAQGGYKADKGFTADSIEGELDGFTDANKNSVYSSVLDIVSDQNNPLKSKKLMVEQIDRILQLEAYYGGWSNFVDKNIPSELSDSSSVKKSLTEFLERRTAAIKKYKSKITLGRHSKNKEWWAINEKDIMESQTGDLLNITDILSTRARENSAINKIKQKSRDYMYSSDDKSNRSIEDIVKRFVGGSSEGYGLSSLVRHISFSKDGKPDYRIKEAVENCIKAYNLNNTNDKVYLGVKKDCEEQFDIKWSSDGVERFKKYVENEREILRELGLIKTNNKGEEFITLYRGLKKYKDNPDTDDKMIAGARARYKIGERIKSGKKSTYKGNYCDSWTLSPRIASQFAGSSGYVLKSDAPINRVIAFAYGSHTFDHSTEAEVILDTKEPMDIFII